MKQNITPDQLNELSPDAKEKLRKWWDQTTKEYHDTCGNELANYSEEYLPLLSIGQMIEFLNEQTGSVVLTTVKDNGKASGNVSMPTVQWSEELCDALWNAVKEVLSGDKPETL